MDKLKQKKFFKITNEKEVHDGFQYQDGLNILKEPFSEEGSCVPGGFYFTDIEHISDYIYLDFGVHLREVQLPFDDEDFKVVGDGNKWRSNKIILGKKYLLNEVETYQYLISLGMNLKENNYFLLRWLHDNNCLNVIRYLNTIGIGINDIDVNYFMENACINGYIDLLQYYISQGADIHKHCHTCLVLACKNGRLEIIKYLIHNVTDFTSLDKLMEIACLWGHLEVVKYFISHDTCFMSEIDRYAKIAAKECHIDVVKYLVALGADISSDVDDYLIETAIKRANMKMVEYLLPFIIYEDMSPNDTSSCRILGMDTKSKLNKYVQKAIRYERIEIIKYFVSLGADVKRDIDKTIKHMVGCNNMEIFKYLFSLRLDDYTINKILLSASQCGYLEIIDFLHLNGIDIRRNNDAALMAACECDNLYSIEYLVYLGADIHAQNDCVFDIACKKGYLNIIEYLVGLDADFVAKMNFKELFITAAKKNKNELIYYLVFLDQTFLSNNINVLKNIIHCTLENNNFELVRFLLTFLPY